MASQVPWKPNTHSSSTFPLLLWWAWATLAAAPWFAGRKQQDTTEKEINLVFGLCLPSESEKQLAISAGRLPAMGLMILPSSHRSRRENERCSFQTVRNQWGRPHENHAGVRFPWSWYAASRLTTSRSNPGCRGQIGLLWYKAKHRTGLQKRRLFYISPTFILSCCLAST